MEINKPKVSYLAYFQNSPHNILPYEYPSKELVPSIHPEDGPLVLLVERIETVLYDRRPRKEGSNSAVENVPDQTS